MEYNIHVISHTHWDREWYQSLDKFRYRLVKLIDNLIEILETDPRYRFFMMDGHIKCLEDYLELRPDKRPVLERLARSGRILVGPWYVLPDEFLISGETHIRNLLIGETKSKNYGGPMKVGYLPDSFGHIAQMPQILKKSGIEYSSFWRGGSRKINVTEFIWRAPDGSEVLTLYMPFGYGTACSLPEDDDSLFKRIEDLINKLAPYTTTSHILLMNGMDHVEPDGKLSEKLDLIRLHFPNLNIVHSNFPYMFRKISEVKKDFYIHEGELRSSEVNILLGGTLSTRIYLKQKHYSISSTLEKIIEPMASFLWLHGNSYPLHFINYIWERLLENCPHDSICGCSVDEVHEEMMVRYRKIEDIMSMLQSDMEMAIARLIESCSEDSLVIFNPHPFPVTAFINTEVNLNKRKIVEVNYGGAGRIETQYSAGELAEGLLLQSGEEKIQPTVIESKWVDIFETPPDRMPEIHRAEQYKVSFVAEDLPPMGIKVYSIHRAQEKDAEEIVSDLLKEVILDNEYYSVYINKDGISVYDKELDISFPLNPLFEDGADAGDEYDYSPCKRDKIILSSAFEPIIKSEKKSKYEHTAEIYYEMEIPKALTSDRETRCEERVILPIHLKITLYSKIKRIDFSVNVLNNAQDHRLRILFSSPVKANTSLAEGHFAIIERNIDNTKTTHQKNYVFIQDKNMAFTVMNKGLPEYEVIKDNDGHCCVAITLLRCVGWLSRGDLLTRSGNGGWTIPTPGAQCQGSFSFQIAITTDLPFYPEKVNIQQRSEVFSVAPVAFQGMQNNGFVNDSYSLFSCDNSSVVLSAFKKADDREELVVRLFNPTPIEQTAQLNFNNKMKITEVKVLTPIEDYVDDYPFQTDRILVTFSPYEIKTLGIIFKNKLPLSNDRCELF